MANKYTIGADIRVTGDYKRKLRDFLDKIKSCDRKFSDFTANVIKNSSEMIASIDKVSKKMNTFNDKIINAEEKLITASQSNQDRIGQNIEKLGTKYDQLGTKIRNAYSGIPKGFGFQRMPSGSGGSRASSWSSRNQNTSNTKDTRSDYEKLKDYYRQLIEENPLDEYGVSKRRKNSFRDEGESGWDIGAGSSLKSFFVKMMALQTTVKIIAWSVKKINDVAEKISTGITNIAENILKLTGLEPSEMLNNAMDYESTRQTMDVLAKSTENGQKVYEEATKLAKRTAFTEKDTTEMAQYVLKSGLLPDVHDLEQLGNLASLKPELGAGHAGFSVFDFLNGRVTPLKTNYGIGKDELLDYMKKLPNKKEYKNAFNKKGAVKDKKQAFNLLMAYINDNYANLAQIQSNTLKGRFSTIQGQFEQFGSDLMGVESKTGEVQDNGVVQKLKNFLGQYNPDDETYTGLMKTLDDLTQSDSVKRFSETLGSIVESVTDVINQGIDTENLKAFLDMLSNIGDGVKSIIDKFKDLGIMQSIVDVLVDAGNRFADMLKTLSESKEYETFLQGLPSIIKQSLDYEMAKLKLAVEFSSHVDALTYWMQKATDFVNFMTKQMQGGDKEVGRQYKVLTGQDYADGLDFFKKTNGDQNVDFTVGDEALTNWLESEGTNYMTEDERDNLKNYINNDYKSSYDITLEYHNGKYDKQQLVDDLLKLLDEADSNND